MKIHRSHWKMPRAAAALLAAALAAGCGRGAESPTSPDPAGEPEGQIGEPAQPDSPAPRASAPRPAPKPAPPKPAQETVRKTVPTGTPIHLSLASDLATDNNQSGDRFEATVTEPVVVDGLQVIPAGSVVEGVLTDVKRAKKLTGGATMTLAFRGIRLPGGHSEPLAASLTSEGAKSGKKSAAIIGGSAAGGAILGKVIGKDTKDAAIGSIIGGAIGAGVAASRDKELRLPAGTELVVVTEQPLRLPVRVKAEG